MKGKKLAIIISIFAYVSVAFFIAEYIAGVAYFIINRTMPDNNIDQNTWYSYWHWYSFDPIQRKRLQLAAGLAAVLMYVLPLIAISSLLSTRQRSLHGDARWATTKEIRKAGLL